MVQLNILEQYGHPKNLSDLNKHISLSHMEEVLHLQFLIQIGL